MCLRAVIPLAAVGRGVVADSLSHGPGLQSRLCSMPRTILLVDDDPLIRAAYGELLRQDGFRVIEAADGCEALLAAASFEGDCLVLLDQFMPCLDGHEFLERLTQRPDASRFRVIIIASGVGAERLLQLGTEVAAVVEKPFSAAELLSTVHRLAA